ncbi:MAG TPA: hypothetical protein DDY98_02665 [Ruminococcaceae bacterium]|nr:hypothetical protein [Oscillospiraceae bacterium]
MKTELHNYDIFPKVFPAGKAVSITVKPMGLHAAFVEESYTMVICPLDEGCDRDYPHMTGFEYCTVKPEADGCIRFTHTFETEQEYFIRLQVGDKRLVQLSVFALNEDLCGRYPFVGDLHMHTFRSDGKQSPAVVAANYRRYGYDFLAITDHCRYYPSLEAIKAYKDVDIEYNLVPGEEVHMPKGDKDHINDVHIVNFGGLYSVNALVRRDTDEDSAVCNSKENRSTVENCPEQMSEEEFYKTVDAYADTIEIPEGVERFSFACCQWEFEQIKKAGGLAIFAHPFWINNVYQVPPKLSEALFANRKFSAFEVLGGENYFEHNGFQTLFYYEQCAKGRKYPVVGSTDSHSSINNRNARICSTIVFAPENTREALIASVNDSYSVAVDTISTEYRLVGDFRLVRYANFIYNNFLPLHDELCYEEGRLMREYACGDEDAARVLKAICGRMKKQREKYFAF